MILDGVYQMMSRLVFVAWAAKPTHGGLDALAANALFEQYLSNPQLPKDMLGTNPKDAQRVAVRTKDLIIFRDQQIKSQGYGMSGPENIGIARALF